MFPALYFYFQTYHKCLYSVPAPLVHTFDIQSFSAVPFQYDILQGYTLCVSDENTFPAVLFTAGHHGCDSGLRIFGIGNVRSALLVGLDKEQDIYNEIITLAEIGVIPCLSAFRALPKTLYENDLGPENEYLLKVYNRASEMLLSMSGNISELGPSCKACRNNMLIL